MIAKELSRLANPDRAKIISGFFKTGKGQYGEGDVFLGIYVPDVRAIAKKYCHIQHEELERLLKSRIHEHRLAALMILVHTCQSTNEKEKTVNYYLSRTKYINNWDLVDLTADKILGSFLLDKKRDVLDSLSKSKNFWERRIAIVATLAFIRSGQYEDTFRITKTLMNDKHDLIHKACGWMLREIGKRNLKALEAFLNRYCKKMPRTMLRYAIERMNVKKRREYLQMGMKIRK